MSLDPLAYLTSILPAAADGVFMREHGSYNVQGVHSPAMNNTTVTHRSIPHHGADSRYLHRQITIGLNRCCRLLSAIVIDELLPSSVSTESRLCQRLRSMLHPVPV